MKFVGTKTKDRKGRLQIMSKLENALKHDECNSPDLHLEHLRQLCASLDPPGCIPEFQQLGFVHSMVMIAVNQGTVQQIDVNDIRRHAVHSAYLDDVVALLTSQKRWRDCLKILGCTDNIWRKARWFLELREENELWIYSLIRKGTEDIGWLIEWVQFAVLHGQARLFSLLIWSEKEPVQRAVSNVFEELTPCRYVMHLCRWRLRTALDPNDEWTRSVDFNKCLSMACEAGLVSSFVAQCTCPKDPDKCFPTPLSWAVHYNQPDLVRLLYRAGAAVSNSEVFWLSKHPKLQERCQAERRDENLAHPPTSFPSQDDVDSAIEIRDFLFEKASRPMSLQDLCLKELTKHVGWGLERDKKVELMGIPVVLKDMLTYKDKKMLTTEWK